MLPEPLAVIVSAVPEALPPRTIPPFVPVERRAKVPLAVIELEVVRAPAPPAESVRLILLPVETPLPVRACESVTVTLPVVLNVMLGVTTAIDPIAPDPLVKATEVEPVSVPAV